MIIRYFCFVKKISPLFIFSFPLCLLPGLDYAQDSTKSFHAVRVTSAPKIDGLLDDEAWKNAKTVSDFIQNIPYEGKPVTQKTEVHILYDNFAIYVAAM